MAIPIEATTVLLLMRAVGERFGGLSDFYKVIPNGTFLTDEDLGRVSFMREVDADGFTRELEHYGLRSGFDFAVIRMHRPVEEQMPSWARCGPYEKVHIAWLTGTEASTIVAPVGWDPSGEQLTHYSPEQAEERLEFVRSDDGVDVYRDRVTGQEVYTARTEPRCVRLFREAVELADPHILVDGSATRPATGRDQLVSATELLTEAVGLEDRYWQAWWYLGKCWQALEEREKAYEAFRRAADRSGDENRDTWRELMFECLRHGRADEGLEAALRAADIAPEDDGIISNLALAYLIAGRLDEALATVKKARKMNRRDPVTKNLAKVIKEVKKGKRPPPRSLADLG